MNSNVASFEKRCQQLAEGFSEGTASNNRSRILQVGLEGPRFFKDSRRRPSLTIIRRRTVSSRGTDPISPAPSPEIMDRLSGGLSPKLFLSRRSSISLPKVGNCCVWKHIGFQDLRPLQAADCSFFLYCGRLAGHFLVYSAAVLIHSGLRSFNIEGRRYSRRNHRARAAEDIGQMARPMRRIAGIMSTSRTMDQERRREASSASHHSHQSFRCLLSSRSRQSCAV